MPVPGIIFGCIDACACMSTQLIEKAQQVQPEGRKDLPRAILDLE